MNVRVKFVEPARRPLQVLAVMDSAAITVTCTSMGGDQLSALTLDRDATVSALLASIRQRLPLEEGAWSLVLPMGELLDEAQADTEIRLVFGFAVPTEGFDCFLSHDWANGNHEKVVQIATQLRDLHGLKPWLDAWHMSENTQEAMAKGVKESALVVVFVTQNYMEKINA